MRCNARVPRNNRNKKEFSVLIRAMRENDGFREREREKLWCGSHLMGKISILMIKIEKNK